MDRTGRDRALDDVVARHVNGTVRALMTGAIDYAGLFPPAALSMRDAVGNFARYRSSSHAWMLGCFVVPAARLEELADSFTAHAGAKDDPWPLSVIARGSDVAALVAYRERYGARLAVRMIEAPPTPASELGSLDSLAALWPVYVEVDAASDPHATIDALKRHGLRAKIRTGGVNPELFPAADAVARFVDACHAAGVPFKATAGLHHLWRGEYALTYEPGSAQATMFGFANVLLGAGATLDGADAREVAELLAGRDGAGFVIADAACVLPSGRALTAAAIGAARDTLVHSFGSCSFEEPVAELTARGLL